ncbi:unnamed protein product [Aspergillus oryzae]|uniref:ubiquitinyl hydrolase 1 n=2 Tax=Aspergillus oryzae TaxID=5062 RepID=A0AAN4YUC8_ASPOZ|nr:unnamed protein product [Aspergillus oryzae]GMF95704.1 unnamed protein product [Aspergillus oryzae]GMG34988.1 unnamed protein product [Aspergillus oryzae]GMG54675.1 unnamed protein product [Aspergillus oryzae var. brunneus]
MIRGNQDIAQKMRSGETGKNTVLQMNMERENHSSSSPCSSASTPRDVVDDGDEKPTAKFELVYTIGDQQPVQLSPKRWLIAHEVLDLIRRYTEDVKTEFPQLVEVGASQEGSFRHIRIFGANAQRGLIDYVAAHICETGVSGFPIARQPKTVREAVRIYITKLKATDDHIQETEKGSGGFLGTWYTRRLVSVTGSFRGGEPSTKLAVPYRAKDSPTARSEYSHPDAVIVLTCLSWYYGGLSNEDLFSAFSHLLKTDQVDMEYQLWVKDAYQLPTKFQQLVSINLDLQPTYTRHIIFTITVEGGAGAY